MSAKASTVLQRRGVFASRDPEESGAFMRTKEFELDLARPDAGAFDFVATAAYLPNSYIGYVGYGAPVRVRVPPERKRDDYFIHLPVRGHAEVANAAGGAVCGPGRAVVSSPAGHLMRSEEGSGRITISLTKAAIMAQLGSLLDDTPTRPLEFSPAINLGATEGRRFSRHARLLIADLDDPASAGNPILLGMYEHLIMTGLLLCQANTYSDALCRLERHASPRAVHRAIDFMEANLGEPLTLAEIAAASRVPGRTLLMHFHDHRGTSPMRYLRDARIGRIRQELISAQGGESVTEIATAFGIHHLGRFAVEYRRRFGETPSETLRRAGRPRSYSRLF